MILKFTSIMFVFSFGMAITPVTGQALDSDLVKPSLHTGYRADLCADLVKECLGTTKEVEKTSCLHSSSQHLFCEGGRLGQLTYKRWAFSPDPGSENDEKIDPPDPALIDQACIASFDSRLTSQIMKSEFQNEDLDQLSNALDSCIQKPAPTFFRP